MDKENNLNNSTRRLSKSERIKRRKKIRRKRTLKILLISMFFLLIFAVGFGAVYMKGLLENVDRHKLSDSNEDLGIDDEYVSKKYITNILLLGVDSRDKNDRGRSDAMMILTVDTEHKKIKLSSLMRDSYVSIDGHGKDKLNHAFAFGGPQLAIKTINQNFGLNIKDFVLVDYNGLEAIIDAVGGVNINIKENEFKLVNDYIHDLAVLKNIKPKYLDKSGEQTLTGIQAVAYTRIRYVGDGDYERTERQRRVLSAIFTEIKDAGITTYPKMVNKLIPYVTTSLTNSEMLGLGTDVLKSGMSNIEQMRFPVDGYFQDKEIYSKTEKMNLWYLVFNQEATREQLYDYIFEDITPVPGDRERPDLGN